MVKEHIQSRIDSALFHLTDPRDEGTASRSARLEYLADLAERLADSKRIGSGPAIVPAGELRPANAPLPEVIVGSYCHRKEVTTITAGTTVGKSWLLLDLALCVVTGQSWLGRFPVRRGRVLFIDYELGDEWLTDRLWRISNARGWGDQFDEQEELVRPGAWRSVDVLSLRQQPIDVHGLSQRLSGVSPGYYNAVIVDPYKDTWPDGTDPNAAGSTREIMSAFRSMADRLNTSIWINSHPAKGDLSARSLADLMAGSYVGTATADNFLGLLPHKVDGHSILEGACRNLPRPDPIVVRWDYPVWTVEDTKDPTARRAPGDRVRAENDERDITERILPVIEQAGEAGLSENAIREQTADLDKGVIGVTRLKTLLARIVRDGQAGTAPGTGTTKWLYVSSRHLPAQPYG